MKNILFTVLAVIFYGNAFSARGSDNNISDSTKVIALINTAKWCPTCRANSKRIEQDIVSQFSGNDSFKIVVNDLTNQETRKASLVLCQKLGIAEIAESNNSTGMIYFINAKTKQIISEISVSKNSDEVILAFNDALTRIE